MVPRCEWGEDSAENNSTLLVYDGGNVSSSSSSPALPPCDDEGYLGPEYGLAVTETRMNKAYILVRQQFSLWRVKRRQMNWVRRSSQGYYYFVTLILRK